MKNKPDSQFKIQFSHSIAIVLGSSTKFGGKGGYGSNYRGRNPGHLKGRDLPGASDPHTESPHHWSRHSYYLLKVQRQEMSEALHFAGANNWLEVYFSSVMSLAQIMTIRAGVKLSSVSFNCQN